MGGVVVDKGNASHRRAAFGGEIGTFDCQILDQDHSIALGQRHAVAVAVAGVAGDIVGPGAGVIIKPELIAEIARPVMVAEAGEHARGQNLRRGILGPHG